MMAGVRGTLLAGALLCLQAGAAFSSLPALSEATGDRVSVTGDPASGRELFLLTVIAKDGETDEELECRLVVVDSQSNPAYQPPAASCFYHPPNGQLPGYFYSRGHSSIFVPAGPTTITINRGFEYQTVVDTIAVRGDTTVTYHLNRWIDMNELGLYSGDCHTHADHSGGIYSMGPEDALFIARAEGLNVINCLDNTYCFTGGPDTCSTADCIVYMSEEYRSSVYGHSGLLGMGSLITPVATEWWPPLMDVADGVHEQEGAAIISAHPLNTADFFDIFSVGGKMLARELPVDVAKGKIDGYELLAGDGGNHTRTRELWYRILNCGFRLAPCGGTDSCMNAASAIPPGSYRVYVQVPGDFNYDTWLSNMIAGRTYVTNGPLFTTFEVRSFSVGDSVALGPAGVTHMSGRVRVECETPLTRVDLICNGHIYLTFYANEGECVIDRSFVVTIDESSWISARASGPPQFQMTVGDSLFAQSGPVYFTMNGQRILDTESAEEMVEWVENLRRLCVLYGEWDVPEHGVRLMEELAAARAFYRALAAGASAGIDDGQPAGEEATLALLPCTPNPFREGSTIRFSIEREGRATLRIYDLSGRLVRTLVDHSVRQGPQAAFWDGFSDSGAPCASGVYLCRLASGGRSLRSRIVLIR
jgi:hypothetical protein